VSENLLVLGQMGELYGCRASDFMPGLPEVSRFQIDAAAAMKVFRARQDFAGQSPLLAESMECQPGNHVYV